MKKILLIIALILAGVTTLNAQTVSIGGVTTNGGPKGDAGDPSSMVLTTTGTSGAASFNGSILNIPQYISGSGGGTGNEAIILCTTLNEITAAGQDAIVYVRGAISLTANFKFPTGQKVYYDLGGSIDVQTYEIDVDGTRQTFNGKELGLDLSEGTIIGSVDLNNEMLYVENIGGVDDGVFDNWQTVYNGLHIVNQNSSILYFNKQTATDTYYMQVYDDTYVSPFFAEQNDNLQTLTIGNGYDNVTIKGDGKTKIKTFADNLDGSAVFVFHNTENSKIDGLHFIGDRYEHFYDEVIRVTGAASSGGDVRLRIREYADFQNTNTLKEINELITLTIDDLAGTRQQVIDHINTDAAFSDYTATAEGGSTTDIRLRTTAGQYCDAFFTNETSGATVSYRAKYYEWGHCIVQGSRAVNSKITNNIIQDYHGDGIAKNEQGNGTPNIDFADLTQGFIDDTGNISANTEYYYSDIRNMPTPHNWFQLMNSAYTSVKFLHFRYWLIYLDDSNNFIEKSPQLSPFTTYEYPSEFKKYRLLVDDVGTEISEFNWFVNSPSEPKGGIISHNTFKDNRRHAITNVLNDQVVEHNYFYRNSGISPEIDLNVEDWGKKVAGQVIRYNHFQVSNTANISLKGANGVQIYGNKFIRGSHQINTNIWNTKTLAITVSYARNAKIFNNVFEGKQTYVDIITDSYNNHYTNSVLAMRNGSPIIRNEIFVNSRIGDGSIGGVDGEGLGGAGSPIFENSVFYINEDWGNEAFVDEANTIKHKNIKYYFNHKASNHFAISDESLRTVYFNDTSNNYLRANETTADNGEHEGDYDGTFVYGAKVASNMLHRVGWAQYAAPNKDFYHSTSLIINNGYFKNFKIEDGYINGWLWLELGEFPNDGVGDFKTVTIKDVVIHVPSEVDATEGHLDNSKFGSGIQYQNLIRILQDANINVVFDNVTFKRDDTTNNLGGYFGHRGTLTFRNCTWDFASAENIDFTSTGSERTPGIYAGANLGNITNTNPTDVNNNVTFTYKGGDTGNN